MYQAQCNGYVNFLRTEERSPHTIEKYIRDMNAFLRFLGDRPLTKQEVVDFKAYLLTRYAPSSVNSMLAAVNGFLGFLDLHHCRVKPVKLQKPLFSHPEKELTLWEYKRLVTTAQQRGNERLALLLQTICATGIRVSELAYITVSSLHARRTIVRCKGKNRVIFFPKELCKMLKLYCKNRNITSGSVFITKTGMPMNRSNIWAMMKELCKKAKVEPQKVFPHNLRHLFARTYYKMEKDISRLADILGHSSINTTRIYTMETGKTHMRQMERMGLVYTRE